MKAKEWPIAGGDGRGANEITAQMQHDARKIHEENSESQMLALRWQKLIFGVLFATLVFDIIVQIAK